MFRPTHCIIHLSALRHNFRELKKKAPHHFLMGMVKANAYGHGSVEVAKVLAEEGAPLLGVASVEEGIELRNAGIQTPILCLGGPLGASAQDLLEHQLSPVVFNRESVEKLCSELKSSKVKLPVHLKMDTGMTRIGIQPHDFSNLLHLILDSNSLELQSIMTHLARADEIEQQAVQNQIEIFHSLTQDLKNLPKKIPFYHIANSAALIKQKIQGTNMARPGIALYGAYPHPDMKELIDLKPVLSWKSKIISLKQVPAHTPISYGGTYVTTRPSKIAIMPVGYADGYSRAFSNIGEVLVRGHRAPVRGRVCMDLTMIDVTDIKNVALEDEVVLIGKQESQEIRAEELAAKTNTISYEIFTSISARVPRIIVSAGENS